MKHEQGFSMLEVLIAMLIILIGILGTAGIQMLAVQSTGWAQYQSQAALLASSMGAAMRQNTAYWAVTAPSSTITINGTSISPTIAAGTCGSGVCSPSEQAGYDLSNWGSAVAKALPSGTATVDCPNTNTPVTCTLTITWNASSTGVYAKGNSTTLSYSTLVGLQ